MEDKKRRRVERRHTRGILEECETTTIKRDMDREMDTGLKRTTWLVYESKRERMPPGSLHFSPS